VKKYGVFFVKMPARSLFRDGGSTFICVSDVDFIVVGQYEHKYLYTKHKFLM
jgi:hypothetical protein